MVNIIDSDWLQRINDEIDEQVQQGIDNAISEIEYRAADYADSELDNVLQRIKEETCLDFSSNRETKDKIRRLLIQGINNQGIQINDE